MKKWELGFHLPNQLFRQIKGGGGGEMAVTASGCRQPATGQRE